MKRQDKIYIGTRINENKKLETETRVMEQRLNLLKSALNSGVSNGSPSSGIFGGPLKYSRNGESSGPLWSASRPSAMNDPIQKRVGAINLSKVKLRTLKQEPDVHKSSTVNDYCSEIIKKITTQVKQLDGNMCQSGPSLDAVQCGQCETKEAAVACQECDEKYCARCFARFHMKGALRRHHSLPLSLLQKCHRTTSQPQKHEVNKDESSKCQASSVEIQTDSCQTHSLGAGDLMSCSAQTDYNKDGGRHVQTENKEISVSQQSVPTTIRFTPAVSYAERLMLGLHRRCQIAPSPMDVPSRHNFTDDLEETVENDTTSFDFSVPRLTFARLHALATADLKVEDIQTLCTIEDVEELDPYVNTNTSGAMRNRTYELKSSIDTADQLLKMGQTTNGTIATKAEGLMQSLLCERKFDVTQSWENGSGDTSESVFKDLVTIELIKQHLNALSDSDNTSQNKEPRLYFE